MTAIILVCLFGGLEVKEVKLSKETQTAIVELFHEIDDGCGCTPNYVATKQRLEKKLCTAIYGKEPVRAELKFEEKKK